MPKRETFNRVLDGQIGEILTAEATYNTGELWHKDRQSDWTDMQYKVRNWLYYNWLSGDHIIEQAILSRVAQEETIPKPAVQHHRNESAVN